MAISGVGTELSMDGGTIGEVFSITGPNMSRTTIDTTHYGVTDGYMTFIGGLRDPGDLTFTMNFGATEYDDLKSAFESDANKEFIMTLKDGTTITFDGLVTELPLSVPVNDRVTSDVTIKVSGAVSVTPGSA